jgi:aarF domain-containing kinase
MVMWFIRQTGSLKIVYEQCPLLLQIQAAELLTSVFSALSKHKVKLESNFASIIIAIMVLEGLGRVLDPELDLLEKARPILLSS